jgi:hypothetical protein
VEAIKSMRLDLAFFDKADKNLNLFAVGGISRPLRLADRLQDALTLKKGEHDNDEEIDTWPDPVWQPLCGFCHGRR